MGDAEDQKNIMQLVHDMGEVKAMAFNNKEQIHHHTDCISELYKENKTMLKSVTELVIQIQGAAANIKAVAKSSEERDKLQDEREKERKRLTISLIIMPIVTGLIGMLVVKFFGG